jgi:hypothetical protein
MKRAFATYLLAAMPIFGAFGTAIPSCAAWGGGTSCCSTCDSDWSCCPWLNDICHFRLVDDCTHCAWRRTWYGPNALATPLRQYYIPRPQECSDCDGCAAGYVLGSFPAERVALTSEVSPAAAAGFSPARFERLGQLRNELDVINPAGTSTRTR